MFDIYSLLCLFIYFWLHWVFIATHGLSLVVESKSYPLVVVHGLLIAVASFVGIIDFRCTGFSSCSTWAQQLPLAGSSMCGLQWLQHRCSQALECAGYSLCGTWSLLLHSMWSLSGPWIKLVSSSLAGRFLSTVPPEKSKPFSYKCKS